MSIVSSRVSSVASILKTPGSRSSMLDQPKRIRFKLPDDLKSVIHDFESGIDCQMYKDLVCILRDSTLKDNELLSLLSDVRQCVSLLDEKHGLLIEALLNITWTNRSSEVTTAFKRFIEDLTCLHVYHTKFVMDKLIKKFKPVSLSDPEWEDGKPSPQELQELNHIHDVLQKCLIMIPMSKGLLLQSLTSAYPHETVGPHSHELYVYALLQITQYAPYLRRDILQLIVHELVKMDVNSSPADIHSYEENRMEEDDDDGAIFSLDDTQENERTSQQRMRTKHPTARSLDVCMEHMFSFIHDSCHVDGELNSELYKNIYKDLIYIFDQLILRSKAHHVQFLIFYLCSLKPGVADVFIEFLWKKVIHPNLPNTFKESAVSYIASFLARATFVPLISIQGVLYKMSNWIQDYINSQDSLEYVNSDLRFHRVFYSICQGMFYLIAFRHKDLMNGKKNLLFLEKLLLQKIVTCRLNPLKVCQPAVVQNFALMTKKYGVAYCDNVTHNNSRNNLPTYYMGNVTTVALDPFFPFDPYLLQWSEHWISPLYYNSQCMALIVDSPKRNQCEDEDDFMDESFSADSGPHSYVEKFSYGTSPGFMQT